MAGMDAQGYGATTVDRTVTVDRTAGWPGAGSRVSWGAVFAGVVIAVALQLVLTLLGAAIGLTALDGEDSGKAFGIGAGIWALLVPLVTMFVGGMTAGRLANVRDRTDGFLHGALVWGVALLLAAWLLGTGASRLIGGTLNLAGNLGGSAVSAAGSVASRGDVDAGSVQNADDRIRQEAAQRGITEDSARRALDNAQQRAGQIADKAQGFAAGGAWLALLALGLSLLASVLGARRAVPHTDVAVKTTTHRTTTA